MNPEEKSIDKYLNYKFSCTSLRNCSLYNDTLYKTLLKIRREPFQEEIIILDLSTSDEWIVLNSNSDEKI